MQRPSILATLLLAAVGAAGLHQLSGSVGNTEVSTANKPTNDESSRAAGVSTLDRKSPKTLAQWQQEGKIAAQAALRNQVCSFTNAGDYCRDSGEVPTYTATAKAEIAILPDPIHTSIDLEFDRALESIQFGLEDSGWNLDRQ